MITVTLNIKGGRDVDNGKDFVVVVFVRIVKNNCEGHKLSEENIINWILFYLSFAITRL
jgi:hypothetical protein